MIQWRGKSSHNNYSSCNIFKCIANFTNLISPFVYNSFGILYLRCLQGKALNNKIFYINFFQIAFPLVNNKKIIKTICEYPKFLLGNVVDGGGKDIYICHKICFAFTTQESLHLPKKRKTLTVYTIP